MIANNVIYGNEQGGQGGINASNGTIVEHNLFVGDGAGANLAWEVVTNCVVKNNIFTGQSPQAQISVTGTRFENNLSFNTPNDVFPSTSGNLSINNIEATNPLLVNVPFAPSIDFSTFDPNLQVGSLAIGGGEDGTDIGVTGGAVPYGEEGTLIPLIQTLSVPTMVVEGEDLNIRIKAKGN